MEKKTVQCISMECALCTNFKEKTDPPERNSDGCFNYAPPNCAFCEERNVLPCTNIGGGCFNFLKSKDLTCVRCGEADSSSDAFMSSLGQKNKNEYVCEECISDQKAFAKAKVAISRKRSEIQEIEKQITSARLGRIKKKYPQARVLRMNYTQDWDEVIVKSCPEIEDGESDLVEFKEIVAKLVVPYPVGTVIILSAFSTDSENMSEKTPRFARVLKVLKGWDGAPNRIGSTDIALR
jgi:hypothetical protein